MATAIEDPVILEAQKRLLQKRAALNQTGNLGQRIKNIDFEEIASRCVEKCQEEGAVVYAHSCREEETPKKRVRRISGVPKAYGECSFENFTGNDNLVERLKNIAEVDGPGVVLRGNTGCGKTHLAIGMARTIPTEMKTIGWGPVEGCIFTTAPELLLKIRSSFKDGAKVTEEALIDRFASCDLLILDDLGSEKTSEFAITTLYIILDRRIRECRKTIITTNLSQIEIEQTFGARIASRLSSMENIKINMPDHRKKRS